METLLSKRFWGQECWNIFVAEMCMVWHLMCGYSLLHGAHMIYERRFSVLCLLYHFLITIVFFRIISSGDNGA